jgi:hypothetical protein
MAWRHWIIKFKINYMQVSIEIECKTARELVTHLNKIIRTIKIRSRQNPEHDFEVGTHFSDDNCYGMHDVTIKPDEIFKIQHQKTFESDTELGTPIISCKKHNWSGEHFEACPLC